GPAGALPLAAFSARDFRPDAHIVTPFSIVTVSASSPNPEIAKITELSMLKDILRRRCEFAAFIGDSSRCLKCGSKLVWMIAPLRNGSWKEVGQRHLARGRGGQNGTNGICRDRRRKHQRSIGRHVFPTWHHVLNRHRSANRLCVSA